MKSIFLTIALALALVLPITETKGIDVYRTMNESTADFKVCFTTVFALADVVIFLDMDRILPDDCLSWTSTKTISNSKMSIFLVPTIAQADIVVFVTNNPAHRMRLCKIDKYPCF